MPPRLGRRLQVGVGRQVVGQRRLRVAARDHGGGGAPGQDRGRAGAEIGQAQGGEAAVRHRALSGQADDRVVAAAAGEFGKPGGGRAGVDLDGDEEFVGRERGREQAGEEIGGRNDAATADAAGVDPAAEGKQTGGEFGGRVGVGQRAADGAAGADRGMGDVGGGAGEQRRRLGDDG